MKLNGNTFLITNKSYNHANLAQWGTNGRDMGTYEQKIHTDQFWRLEEDSNHEGYFYIHNVKHDGYRLRKWGSGDGDTGIYTGQYYDNQMWKFVHEGDDYYRIFNYSHPKAKLAKWGKGDGDWGTYSGPDYNDQLWKLTPRFNANMQEDIVWECDNRTGCRDFQQKKTVTVGLKLTSSSSISTKVGLEVALKYAASAEVSGTSGVYSGKANQSMEMSSKISTEISSSLSSSEEKSWSSTDEITFCAPAGKNYRVRQLAFRFSSPLASDNLDLKCKWRIEETDGEFPN